MATGGGRGGRISRGRRDGAPAMSEARLIIGDSLAVTPPWPKDFDEGVHALGEHEYLRFNAKPANPDEELKHYPPLPSHLIKGHRT